MADLDPTIGRSSTSSVTISTTFLVDPGPWLRALTRVLPATPGLVTPRSRSIPVASLNPTFLLVKIYIWRNVGRRPDDPVEWRASTGRSGCPKTVYLPLAEALRGGGTQPVVWVRSGKGTVTAEMGQQVSGDQGGTATDSARQWRLGGPMNGSSS